MTPTLPTGPTTLQTQAGPAKFSKGWKGSHKRGPLGCVPGSPPGPIPFSLLLLDDLGQAGLRLRRWRWQWRQRLHPLLALGRGGPLNTGHNAGISVGLLRTAGIRVLAHGCCQHHARRHRPGLAAKERGRGGPGKQTLTGRGPCAQSPCPSRWRGEETRRVGRRQSPRRRLLHLPPLLLERLRRGRGTGTGTGGVPGPTGAAGHSGAAARGVTGTTVPAHPRRSELGRRAASATRHREPFGVSSQALLSATPS